VTTPAEAGADDQAAPSGGFFFFPGRALQARGSGPPALPAAATASYIRSDFERPAVPALRLPLPRPSIVAFTPSLAWAGRIVLVALACYLAARLSLALVPPSAAPGLPSSLLWLPTGVATAMMLRWRLSLWPAVALGALAAHIRPGFSPLLSLALAAGQTAGPLAAAWGLKRLGWQHALEDRRDLAQLAVGLAAATLITSGSGTLAMALSGLVAPAQVATVWSWSWVSDAAGALLVGLPLMTLSRQTLRRAFGAWRGWRTALLGAACVASAWLVCWSDVGPASPAAWSPLVFVPPVLLCGLALYSGAFATSLTAFVVAGVAAVAAANGLGPFAAGDPLRGLGLLWAYAATLATAPMLLATLAGELRADERGWRAAIEGSEIGIGELALDTAEFRMSARWLAMLGHGGQPVASSPAAVWDRLHEEDQASVEKLLSALRDGAVDSAHAEFRMQCADGSWKWLAGHAVAVKRAQDRQALRIIVTVRDIAEERAASERHQLSATLFQRLHEGLVITDAAHRVLDVNPTISSRA
jgi:PAS domain S-box-containing protein